LIIYTEKEVSATNGKMLL